MIITNNSITSENSSVEEAIEKALNTRRFMLKFDSQLEKQYKEARHARLVKRIPNIAFASFLIYCTFFALDLFFLPQHVYLVTIAIRLFVVCPLIAFVILGAYKLWPEKLFNIFYVVSYLIGGISVVAILFTARSYDIYLPFDGLLLHLIFGYFLMAMPFYSVVIASSVISVSYFLSEVYLGPSVEQLSYDAIFMLTVNIMGAVGSYLQENSRRKLFIKDKLIQFNAEKDAREIIAKTKLVATASHDLRQPLNAMNLLAETLEEKLISGEALDITHKLQSSIQHLNQLLGSLVNISQLNVGIISPRMSSTNIHNLVNSIIEEQVQRAEQLGVVLTCDGNNQVLVKSDQLLLSRVIRNLLQNALDHAEAKYISISWRVKEKVVRVEVRDDGVGIPEEDRRAIFEEFHQVGDSVKLGMGLGLAIVKQLCELMGINLGIKRDLSKGSCFFLELVMAEDINVEALVVPISEQSKGQLTIFLVEDDISTLESMTDLLTTWGYRVCSFEGPSDALKQIDMIKPDLIISDYRFPEAINGLTFLARVHATLDSVIPAILITADTTHDFESEIKDRLSVKQQHKTYVQFKPVLPVKLKLLLQHCIENKTH